MMYVSDFGDRDLNTIPIAHIGERLAKPPYEVAVLGTKSFWIRIRIDKILCNETGLRWESWTKSILCD